jgi:hypothetical protein
MRYSEDFFKESLRVSWPAKDEGACSGTVVEALHYKPEGRRIDS